MNTTLHERLIRAEQQFLLAAVSNDEESRKIFCQEWSQLVERIKTAGRLDDDTALLLSKVSRAIENTTLCMLEIEAMLRESQTGSIGDFIQDISGDPPIALPHPEPILPCRLLFSNNVSLTIPKILGQQKLLDSYAYRWLIQNIHDPYPNSVQTQVIIDVSCTSAAQVELWFQEVRDSIGWSKLCHGLFAGSVNATVAAARRVYLERDKNISFDIVFAFTVVKASAEVLFQEHPSLQDKKLDTGSARTIGATFIGQDHHVGPFLDGSLESVPVPPQVDLLAPLDPFSDLSDSDESDEEDTTPPPSIAGRKRALAEDVLTSQVCDLGRSQKRRRSETVNCLPSSELECPFPLPSTSCLSSEQATLSNSATSLSPSPSSHLLSPPPLETLPGSPLSIRQRRDEDAPKDALSLPPTHISTHGARKRKPSQNDSPVPSKRQCYPIVPPTGRSTLSPMLSSYSRPDLSLLQGRPSDLDEVPQPTLPILVNPNTPVNPRVYNWKSISDPSTATASSTLQPSILYVPSSDLKSQLPEPPGCEHDPTTRSSSFVDLGSLEELDSSLQFPIPIGLLDLSTLMALPQLGNPHLPLQGFHLSSITEPLDSFSPGLKQSSSPSASSIAPATPPGSTQESLSLSGSCNLTMQPSSVLDSSVAPSVFLPFEPGAFSEDTVWSYDT